MNEEGEAPLNGPVFYHSLTLNKPDGVPDDVFSAFAPSFREHLEGVCDRFIYQLERGATNNRLHLQGYLHVSVKLRPPQLSRQLSGDLPEGYVAFCKRSSTNGVTALKRYCLKDDTRVLGPWTDPVAAVELQKAADEKALEYDPAEEDPDLVAHPYAWQQAIIELLDGPVNSRSVVWIVDPAGCGGKSSFVKSQTEPQRRLSFGIRYGKTSDLLSMVCRAGKKRCYLFDLTRARQGDLCQQDLYAALEQVKDGYVFNTKYEGGVMKMARPHVVVFSNHEPAREFLSLDRWDVRFIHPDLHTLVHAL